MDIGESSPRFYDLVPSLDVSWWPAVLGYFLRGMLIYLPHVVVAGTIFILAVYFAFYWRR